ncbi:MAG: hypothetical protein R3B96_22635 [Pirellulaceae bacterium]
MPSFRPSNIVLLARLQELPIVRLTRDRHLARSRSEEIGTPLVAKLRELQADQIVTPEQPRSSLLLR